MIENVVATFEDFNFQLTNLGPPGPGCPCEPCRGLKPGPPTPGPPTPGPPTLQ